MTCRTSISRWRSRLLALVMALVMVLAVMPIARADSPKHYTELTFPALPEVGFPPYERYMLPNGMVVFLIEDHELPLVSGAMFIRTGERFDPADKVGLGEIMADVMRSGGTLTHPADELNQLLEQKAAAVEVSMTNVFGQAGFSTLSADLPEIFGLFAEVLREPAFPEAKIDLKKKQRQGSIARRNDSPDSISGREFQKLIYGSDSPYARVQEYATLNKIQRQDLLALYQRDFHPNAMILGIVGDFEPQAMKALIRDQFGNWPASPTANQNQLPPVQQATVGGVYVVDQPQLTQSTVMMGELGSRIDDPDVFALYVLSEALNSFGGRLFDEVRSRQGLAYSVYAVWRPQYDFPGLFLAGGKTRSEATVPFIQAVRAELEKVRQTPLSESEITFAKDSILNSFVFNFVDPAQTLSRLLRYEYFDYPKDYVFRYQRAVKGMTARKVQKAAQRSLQPERMVTLVVGNRAQIEPTLETLDLPVRPIDITIPGAASTNALP